MIKYTIPGMTEFADLCLLFATLMKKEPSLFFPDVVIETVYGGFPGSRLCGGRPSLGPAMPAQRVEAMLERYNRAGVGCHVTFTNQHATVEELENSAYDRSILDALAKGPGNGVIVYRDDLAEWIGRQYPQLTLVASTTKELQTVAETEALLALYDRAVLNYNLTHDDDGLFSASKPSQLELMVNEYCTLGCPYRKAHYREISRCQHAGCSSSFSCMHEPAPQAYGFMQGLVEGEVFLKNSQVRSLHDRGYRQFKIVGRGLERYDVIDALMYYLVQPDCWYELRDFLIHHNYL